MTSKIRNACMVAKDFVDIKASKISMAVLNVMKHDGYIEGYEKMDRIIRVYLKYHNGSSVIKIINPISKPRIPIYATSKEIKHLTRKKYSTIIVSTNKGVMAHQDALLNNVGGQLICEVDA